MTFTHLYDNDQKYLDRRIKLRRNQTKAEKVLWQELRGQRILGYVFRRQYSIGAFIVDFYCHTIKLIIELDGPIHEHQQGYDHFREEWLKQKGYHILRFLNDEMLFEREAAIVVIVSTIKRLESSRSTFPHEPPPYLPLRGGEVVRFLPL